MYWLNKVVGFIVSPIGGVIVGGFAAVVCAGQGRKCAAKWLGWGTAAWLWLWMTPIMTWGVGVPLEREFLVDGRVPMVETFPEADAIILLGGGMGINTNWNSYAEMSGGADRVWQTARLFKAKKAPVIIATGDYAKDTTLPLLKDLGVVRECVSFLDAKNTEEEAKEIKGLLGRVDSQRRGAESQSTQSASKPKVLLVTSAWHMKRARLMFKKYAPEVEVICAPADFENSMMAKGTVFLRSLSPDFYAFALNSVALHEWVGIVGYKVFR